MRLLVLMLCFATGLLSVHAQVLFKARVLNEKKEAIAYVQLLDAQRQVIALSDSLGYFSVKESFLDAGYLLLNHLNYIEDTIRKPLNANRVYVLKEVVTIKGFTINSDDNNSKMAGLVVKTELINQAELKKAACCDLAGCFETQGTVQAMTTNIITNAKELRILGLSGVYNQILVDGMPMVMGLAYTYGISSVPGTLVDNIFVSKGSTSVLQGYESMVGQINVVPKSPDKGEKLFLNTYVNSFGENQHNLSFRLGKGKWSNLTALHVVQPAQKWDRDGDGFLDLPHLKRYLFYDKLKYGDENKNGFSFLLGTKIFNEERVGGQWQFDKNKDIGSSLVYGQLVKFTQGEAYLKSAYRWNENERISVSASGVLHEQNSWFGSVHYQAKQKQVYANAQYEKTWRSAHEFKTGLSLRSLNINEQIGFTDTNLRRSYAGNYLKQEFVPGVFAENIFKWRGDLITLITGLRADHHNVFGWKLTPRAMLKIELSEKTSLRASAGTGWRTVNLFSENIGLLVSSRDIVFKEVLNPEQTFNWGLNIMHKIKAKKIEGFVTVDFYQTRFGNQFFPDYDAVPTKAIISNFSGLSVSNGFQTDLNVKYRKLWEIKLAYNYLDVYRKTNGVKVLLPFNSKHKVLAAVSYIPKTKKWRIDVNAHWFGVQRLPNTDLNPEEYQQAKQSKPYSTFNLQLSKTWKRLDVYMGCENILDYRQLKPIVSWQNPFSPYFDTSFNWGPTRGREFYLGFRYKIN